CAVPSRSSVSTPGLSRPHASLLRSTDSAVARCLPCSVFLTVVAFRCCVHQGSSRYSWPPVCRCENGWGRPETPPWPMPSLDLRPDASAAGRLAVGIAPRLPPLYPALGFASAVAHTNLVARCVCDLCSGLEARPATRSALLHSTGQNLVASRD